MTQFAVVCDYCDQAAACVFCMTDGAFLCQNCDVEVHNNRISMRHQRVPYTQCPIWAYREAKSKGRLREGVCPRFAQQGGQQDHGHPAQAQAPSQDFRAAPQSQWTAGAQPSLLSQAWQDRGSARCARPLSTDQSPFGPQEGSAQAAMPPEGATATSLPNMGQWMNGSCPPIPEQYAAAGCGEPGTGGIQAGTAINQNLASLLEEFKLPDGSAEDSLLLELPSSPPSVAQDSYPCTTHHHANQHHIEPHSAPCGLESRQLTGSLKSSNTGLAISAMEYEGRSPVMHASPCSNAALLGASMLPPQAQHEQSTSGGQPPAPEPAPDIRRTTAQLFAQLQAKMLAQPGLLAYATGAVEAAQQPTQSSSAGEAPGQPADAQRPPSRPEPQPPAPQPPQPPQPTQPGLGSLPFPINRSLPLPINRSSNNLAAGAAAHKLSLPGGGVANVVRGLMVPDEDRTTHLSRSVPQQTSSASDLGNSNATTNQAHTPESSLHGSFLAAAALAAAAKGGIASFDDAGLAAALGQSSLASPLSSVVVGGTVHGGTAHSSCLGLARILDTQTGHSHLSSMGIKGSITGLFIETASAASIEARAQALINSSSRNPQPTVLDPSVATRIERPDGTIRELDPERAMQLHRYRQKRMARMKAYTDGQKKIRYECRKQLADSRPRVRGRFAKLGSFDNLASILSEHGALALGEHSMRGANSYAELMRNQRIDEEGLFDAMRAAAVGGSVHGGKAGNISLGRVAQVLRRAASCSQSPLPALLRRSNSGQGGSASGGKPPSRSASLGNRAGAPETPMGAPAPPAAAATPAGSSGQPSAGSPGLASTSRPMPPPQDELPCLGAELDAAIAAACEQECLTVTDQELAALGFGPLTQAPMQTQRANSENSSESMSSSAARMHQQQMAMMHQQQQQHAAAQMQRMQQTHNAGMPPLPMQGDFFRDSMPDQACFTLHVPPPPPPEVAGMGGMPYPRMTLSPGVPEPPLVVDSDDPNMCIDFNDAQVSSMLDELLQGAPSDFAL